MGRNQTQKNPIILSCFLIICCLTKAQELDYNEISDEQEVNETSSIPICPEELLKTKIHEAKVQKSILTSALAETNMDCKKRRSKLRDQLDSLLAEFARLSEEYTQCSKDAVDSCALRAKVAWYQFENHKLSSNLSNIKNNLETCAPNLQILQQQSAVLTNNRENLTNYLNKLEADYKICMELYNLIIIELPKLEITNIELRKNYTGLSTEANDLNDQLKNCKAVDEDALQARIASLKLTVSMLEAQVNVLQVKVSSLVSRLAECADKQPVLENQLGYLAFCPDDLAQAKKSCQKYMMNVTMEKLGSKYYFFQSVPTRVKNWYDANDFCRKYNLQLASVETAEEDQLLRGKLLSILGDATGFSSTFFWIGVNDLAQPGQYVHAGTGQPVRFSNWLPGQPRRNESRFCGGYNREDASSHGWQTEDCQRRYAFFVCEMEGPCNQLMG